MIRVFWLMGLCACLTAVGCLTTNDEGRKTLNFMSDSQMNQLGEQSYQEMKQGEPQSKNKAASDMMVTVGKRIAAASGVNYDWEFRLFASEEVNAFCLPGGKVGVYEGILPIAENEAGLAAIMGHEVAHATLKHGGERVSQGLVAQLGLTAAQVALGDHRYREPLLAALGLGAQVGVLLPYSRLHESEADVKGLEYLAKAGYDPREAPKLWERMDRLSKGGRPPDFLATHPNPSKRAEALRAQLDKAMKLYASSGKHDSRPIPIAASKRKTDQKRM